MFDEQKFLEATQQAVVLLTQASSELDRLHWDREDPRIGSASLNASLAGTFGRSILANAGIECDRETEPDGDLAEVVQVLIDELPWDANWSWSDWLFELIECVKEINAVRRLPNWPDRRWL